MPVVNIGTVVNVFNVLIPSLGKNGLEFSKTVAFMSDTLNLMKGANLGVQKLIKMSTPLCMMLGALAI